MKKHFIKTCLAIVFIGLTLNSCVKDPEDLDTELDLSCLLTYYSGDVWSYNFYYDNQKRLNSVTYYYDGTQSTYETTQYSGGQVSQMTKYQNGSPTFYEEYTFGNNLTVEYYTTDEFGNWYLEDRYIYTYFSSGLIKQRDWYHDTNDGNGLRQYGYRKYTWSNNNISKREYWFSNKKIANIDRINKYDPIEYMDRNLKSTTDELSYTATFQYDSKNNAFASIGLFFLDTPLTKNNVTRATYNYNDGRVNRSVFTYSYNADGFPDYRTEVYTPDGEEPQNYENYFSYQCNQ